MKNPLVTTLTAHLCLKPSALSSTQKPKERILRQYPEVVSYLYQTYANDYVIAEADAALTRYTQSSTMSRAHHVQALVTKLLRRGEVYDDHVLKGIFMKGFKK